jgi:hypothetical protein
MLCSFIIHHSSSHIMVLVTGTTHRQNQTSRLALCATLRHSGLDLWQHLLLSIAIHPPDHNYLSQFTSKKCKHWRGLWSLFSRTLPLCDLSFIIVLLSHSSLKVAEDPMCLLFISSSSSSSLYPQLWQFTLINFCANNVSNEKPESGITIFWFLESHRRSLIWGVCC